MKDVATIVNRRWGGLAVAAVVAMLIAASPLAPRPAAARPESPSRRSVGPVSADASGASAAAEPRAVPDGAVFVPVAPCRVVDTRVAGGALSVNTTRQFQLRGDGVGFVAQGGRSGGCGVPVSAVAAEVSVTAVDPQGSGFFRMWPSGGPAATATFLNFTGGQGITNTGTVGLGSGTKDLTTKNFGAAAQYVIDVQGYFVAPGDVPVGANGAVFVPVAPCRAVDTRVAGGVVEAGVQRQFQMRGDGAGFASQGGLSGGCGLPESAVAAEVSVTAVAPSGSGFLRMWPSGGSSGSATFLNFTGGQGITNTGTVGLGSGTKDLTVENFGAAAQYVIDVQGYFVPPVFVPATSVVSGGRHTCALRAHGTVSCWGYNDDGQLGYDANIKSMVARSVTGISTATAISADLHHTCALLSDGKIACWGLNYYGELGNGTNNRSTVPVIVTGITEAVAISVGDGRSCALLADGSVRCWGRNSKGQLGDGSITDSSLPVVALGVADAVSISTDLDVSCSLIADGTIKCWGANSYGQLGNGTFVDSAVPTTVAGISDATTVTTQSRHLCAVIADGTIECWGNNYFGQLGNGTTVTSFVPVAVTGISDAIAVTTGPGSSHTCALLADGTVRCWGHNGSGVPALGHGQLGNGTVVDSSVPVTAIGITEAVDIDLGYNSSCARLAGGGMRCWGDNESGQLGNGTEIYSSIPTAVVGVTEATDVMLDETYSCALLGGGTVECWGYNAYGRLGNGTTAISYVPVEVIWR